MNRLFAVFLALLAACGTTKTISGEVAFNGPSEPGTIALRSAGYGPTKAAATGFAERNAFEMLLFRGVPGSQQNLPMVADEKAARSVHAGFFQKFFEGDGCRRFVLSSEPSPFRPTANKRAENLNLALKVDVEALRRELEAEGVIRKFGY